MATTVRSLGEREQAPALMQLPAAVQEPGELSTVTTVRRLVERDQALALMRISADVLDWLIDTGQLAEISICGHKRFDTKDLYALIDDYKVTQRKRGSDV